jgi:hypothetical protein
MPVAGKRGHCFRKPLRGRGIHGEGSLMGYLVKLTDFMHLGQKILFTCERKSNILRFTGKSTHCPLELPVELSFAQL